jgi:hypothetical protein
MNGFAGDSTPQRRPVIRRIGPIGLTAVALVGSPASLAAWSSARFAVPPLSRVLLAPVAVSMRQRPVKAAAPAAIPETPIIGVRRQGLIASTIGAKRARRVALSRFGGRTGP